MESFKLFKKETQDRPFNKKEKVIIVLFIILVLFFLSRLGDSKPTKSQHQLQTTTQQEYPSFTEETMDRDCILVCLEGFNDVGLWSKPTSILKGAVVRDRVSCGTRCWVFNKYYNTEHSINVMYYAVQTNDPRLEKDVWGWVDEFFITWTE